MEVIYLISIKDKNKNIRRIQIFSDYIDEKKGYLLVCDIIWINFSEKDVRIFIKYKFLFCYSLI